MTTAHDHHEPLDAEERDLAARLARTGPLDGPPPALDAKILAAAHAAAATRRPGRHRLAWLGVPPALVTGMGVAAAAVLALGLVWQLRPQYSGITAQGDAGEEEVILVAEPAATAPAPNAKTTPLAEQPLAGAAPRRSRRAAPATLEPAPQPSEDTAKAIAASAAAADAAAAEEASASAAAQAMASAQEKREADHVARAARAAAESGFVAEPPAAPAPAAAAPAVERKTRATYSTAERREQAANAAPAAAAAAPPPPAPVAAAADAEPQTLDRIEVTGSRIKQNGDIEWAGIPVSDDSRLAAPEWLERIRARRDGGDTDNARASLRLFQREHPRVHLPDDLRALLAETRR
jgi:hypothetical protein